MHYHRKEDAKLGVHIDYITVTEDELVSALLLAGQHNGDLLCGHREDRQFDTVELIEAAPGTRLREPLEDAAQTAIVHLIGAVKDHYVLP